MELGGMFPLKLDMEYEVQKITDDGVTSKLSGTLDTAEGATMQIGPGMEASLQMNGTQEGTLTYDRDTGWITAMKMKQQIDGKLQMPNPSDPNGPTMELPMRVNTVVTVESLDD
jgi:hypothetical protein